MTPSIIIKRGLGISISFNCMVTELSIDNPSVKINSYTNAVSEPSEYTKE